MNKKTIIAIDKIGGILEDKDTFVEKGMEKESARREVRKLLIDIAKLNKVLNNRSIHKVPDYDKLCALKAERDSAFDKVWKIYTEYHNIIIQEPQIIANMTAEELAEVLKTVNANRPQVTQTMNFNAPIGQQIAHVDKIEAHFDKDMGMQITNADEVSKQGEQNATSDPNDGVTNRDAIPAGEALFHFIHPEVEDSEEVKIHQAVKNLVKRFGVREICDYLSQMASEKKILLTQKPNVAYDELVRMGMPNGEGFALKTFEKYYRK